MAELTADGQANRNVLIKGCGIGCAVIVVLLIIVVLVGVYFIPRFIQSRMTAFANMKYRQFESEGLIPANDTTLYAEIYEVNQNSAVGLTGATLTAAILIEHLEDGQVTDDERIEATVVRDFFEEHPEGGMRAIDRLVNENPGLKARMEALQMRINSDPTAILGNVGQ